MSNKILIFSKCIWVELSRFSSSVFNKSSQSVETYQKKISQSNLHPVSFTNIKFITCGIAKYIRNYYKLRQLIRNLLVVGFYFSVSEFCFYLLNLHFYFSFIVINCMMMIICQEMHLFYLHDK